MKIALIVFACVAGITLLVRLVRSRIVPTYAVKARDIPEVIRQLQRSGQNGHFAVLMFVPPGSEDDEPVNLQYSIEQGAVGLDWVLLAPRNTADQRKISEFASKVGYRFDEHEMNGVRYLRVTGSAISDLGAKIVGDFYQIGADTKLEMVTEGFQWQAQ